MTREMFTRMATAVLSNMGDRQAAEKAEALVIQMDLFAAMMGDGVAQPAPAPSFPDPRWQEAKGAKFAQSPSVPPPSFPAPNPEAITPAPLIVTDTRMPAMSERIRPEEPGQPVRSLRPKTRMKVEDLSLLVQERTPDRLAFDVPFDDGTTQRMIYWRNVISMHSFDSVKLVYFPPGQTQSAQESVQVEAVLHVDDVPFDLSAILKSLTSQAIQSLQPRGAPRELPVRPFSGPVQSRRIYEDGGAASARAEDVDLDTAVFRGIPSA